MVAEANRARTVRLWELSTGKVRRRLEGHTAQASAGAFSPDGKLLATASADRTGLVWDIYGLDEGALQLDAGQLDALWNELADADASKSMKAIGALARGGAPALAYLKERLLPVAAPDPQRLAEWIAKLDVQDMVERQKAEAEIEKLGEGAIAALRKALTTSKAAPETKKRIEALLARLEGWTLPPDRLRQLRALEAVEVMNSPGGLELVKTVAAGVPEARLTRHAVAAVARLTRRTNAP
jgi:hypothetical protein